MTRRVPATDTTRHIRQLVADGASLTGIAKAAGCAYTTVRAISLDEFAVISDDLANRIRAVTIGQSRSRAGRPPGPAGSDAVHAPGAWADHPDRPCADTDTNLWYPVSGRTGRRGGPDAATKAAVTEAKALCARCPVLHDCRAHGIAHEQWGVWGGLTETEREAIRRSARGAA